MPEHRDLKAYRLQAKLWQDKADAVSCGEECNIYLAIADGYTRLAQLIENRASGNTGTGLHPSPVMVSNLQLADATLLVV